MITYSTRKSVGGFTLIELMTVITIMVILAAVTVAGVGFVNEFQAKKKAQIDIELLSKAIEEYKLDTGKYPGDDANTAVEGDVSEQLYKALFYDGYESQNSDPKGEVKMYVPELNPKNSKQSWVTFVDDKAEMPDNLKILDPWRRSYRYRKGEDKDPSNTSYSQNPDFDLWSTGKDGKTDASNPDRTIKENGDDIRNF